MRVWLLVVAVLVVTVPQSAQAIDPQGRYTIFGGGDVRCATWERGRRLMDSTNAQDQSWISGYVTAYNRWVHKGLSVAPDSDPQSLYKMIDGYCKDNPSETLAGAAESMMLELIRRQ